MTITRYDRVLAASKGGSDASSSSMLASDAVSVDSSTIEQWAKDKSGDWLVMVYLDQDWNCVDYAPAWEAVVDGLQGMIGLGRINMRTSKGLGASLALSGDEGLLLPTLVMFRDGVFMQSRHISSAYSRDSMKFLIAKTYDFVHRYLPLFPAFFAPFPFLSFRPSPLAFFSYLQEFTRHRPPIRITNADELDTAAAPPPNLVHVISRHATGRSRAAVMSQLMLLRLPQWIVVYTIDVKAPFGEC